MTAVAAGIPQLLVPQTTDRLINAGQLTATNAARALLPDDNTPQALREHVTALLTDSTHATAAHRLRSEQDALPDSNAMVGSMLQAVRRVE